VKIVKVTSDYAELLAPVGYANNFTFSRLVVQLSNKNILLLRFQIEPVTVTCSTCQWHCYKST